MALHIIHLFQFNIFIPYRTFSKLSWHLHGTFYSWFQQINVKREIEMRAFVYLWQRLLWLVHTNIVASTHGRTTHWIKGWDNHQRVRVSHLHNFSDDVHIFIHHPPPVIANPKQSLLWCYVLYFSNKQTNHTLFCCSMQKLIVTLLLEYRISFDIHVVSPTGKLSRNNDIKSGMSIEETGIWGIRERVWE